MENQLFQPSKLSLLTLEIVGKLNDLVSEVKTADELLALTQKQVNELVELKAKYSKLLSDYTATVEAYEKFKLDNTSTPVEVKEAFDSAIHNHKPKRPITNTIRLQILDAYQNVYKVDDEVKTLPEFFNYVREKIYYAISNTEIEGVIYNRFDERLYL